MLFSSGIVQGYLPFNSSISSDPIFESSFHNIIEIPPGSDYYIKLNPENFSFVDKDYLKETQGWSDSIISAIAKSPSWLHHDLIRQFNHLEDKNIYADLLLNVSRQITDELAFTIAYSPLGRVAEPRVLLENVQWLYLIDRDIKYADIIDYNYDNGSYYSTVRYTVLENGSEKIFEYPPDVYYWFIVHPKILGEHAQIMYDTFWREFLYTHNDLGYPLLKEKIEDIQYLWDKESYYQPSDRIWREWISIHPTAIEAISYCLGKTMFYAVGDRPTQPSLIAHQHNGYCGEMQRLAVAVQRTLLIPSIGACNIAEDHVWREFYDQGWHQNDNWWADEGGCVDVPYAYTDGWGKDMSSLYAVKGDGRIVDRTSMYLHENETVTVNFTVYDAYLNPYDGAQITAFVKGIKDISWYQYKILEFLENLWDNLSIPLNGTFIETLYHKIQNRIMEIPDIIDGAIISTWNYTDINGFCSFTLGKNDEYIFLIQNPDGQFPWPIRLRNSIRTLKDPKDTDFQVYFNDFSEKPLKYSEIESNGDYSAAVSYNVIWCQSQQHIRTKDIGIHRYTDDIEVLYLDERNFNLYQQGKTFTTQIPINIYDNDKVILLDSKLYVVFVNNAHHASAIIDLSLTMTGNITDTAVSFDKPRSSLFSHPTFNIGDHIELTGSASDTSYIIIENSTISFPKGSWTYYWNTSGLKLGLYVVQLGCQEEIIEKTIRLIDVTPPDISINAPVHNQIFDQSEPPFHFYGHVFDASEILSIEISIDEIIVDRFEYSDHWDISIDPSELSNGIHSITCRAVDYSGNSESESIDIIITDDASYEPPIINNISNDLKVFGNWTTVTIYANAISQSQYPIKELKIHLSNNSETNIKKMYLYAFNPILPRHIEDPFFNRSNNPIYGCSLGDFYKGENIEYWIEAIDFSGNKNSSPVMTIEC